MYVRLFFKYLLALFWISAGINHFVSPEFYVNIMPDYLPAHEGLVMLSGVTEILAGLMVATPRLTRYGAWLCIAHLVVFFTVHVDMIVHAADKYSDIPLAFLWVRIPLQFLFIYWAWVYTRDPKNVVTRHADNDADEQAA
jgi:uncharacterized membrane protein